MCREDAVALCVQAQRFQPGRDVVVYVDSFSCSHKAHVRVESDNYLASELVLSEITRRWDSEQEESSPFAVLYRPMLRMLFLKTFARVRHEREERKLTEVVNCHNGATDHALRRAKEQLESVEQTMVLDAESSKELYDFEYNNGVDLSGTFLRTTCFC